MLAITIDVDWAPDAIVDAVVALFDEAGVPTTLFCTDPGTDPSGNSSVLAGRYHRRHELALHPNFASGAPPESVFEGLRHHYPEAKGFRSHNGYGSWPISAAAIDSGMWYQVECTVFPVDIPPFKIAETSDYYLFVTRFMDSRMLDAADFRWSLAEVGLGAGASSPDHLFVFGFHPNVVFYDIATAAEYEARKPTYHDVVEGESFRHKPLRGPVRLIRELLDGVDRDCFTTVDGFGRAKRLW